METEMRNGENTGDVRLLTDAELENVSGGDKLQEFKDVVTGRAFVKAVCDAALGAWEDLKAATGLNSIL
jgi:hypothetical protein